MRARALILAFAATELLAACRPNTVLIAYRPPAGATYRYAVSVSSVTTTRLGDAAPERNVDDGRYETDNTVLTTEGGEIRVQVRLRRPGSAGRTFVVVLDRGGQVAAVETVEGLPPSVLGPLSPALPGRSGPESPALPGHSGPGGLPEILPAAAAAPPNRPLEPGDRWTIDSGPRLPGVAPTRLRGSGRLVELRVDDGREVADTRATTRLPLASTTQVNGGTMRLEGVETTESESTRLLSDGSVVEASATTRGSFRVMFEPPAAEQGAPVAGTLSIEVRSRTRRLGA